jgi:hypothetical protein
VLKAVAACYPMLRHAILCLGPCRSPPCREQRPLRSYAGLWQGVPLLVLASHLWPGQSGHSVSERRLQRISEVNIKHGRQTKDKLAAQRHAAKAERRVRVN